MSSSSNHPTQQVDMSHEEFEFDEGDGIGSQRPLDRTIDEAGQYDALYATLSNADLLKSNEIRENYTLEERICAHYRKQTGKLVCNFFAPGAKLADLFDLIKQTTPLLSQCPTDEAFSGNLRVDNKRVSAIVDNATSEAIRFSLVKAKASSEMYFTPLSAPLHVCSLIGAKFTLLRDEAGEVIAWNVAIPELPIVRLAKVNGVPQVVDGGVEFYKQFNFIYGQNIHYLALSPDAIRISLVLASALKFDVDRNSVLFSEVPFKYNIRTDADLVNKRSWDKWISYFLAQASKHVSSGAIQLPNGFPSKREPVRVYEYMIYRLQEVMGGAFNSFIKSGVDQIIPTRSLLFQADLNDKMPETASLMADMGIPKVGPILVKGDVAAFRRAEEIRRNGLKADIRKLDSVCGSGMGASNTSVPFKIQGVFEDLHRVDALKGVKSAHAFGVGVRNYFAPTIGKYFKGSVDFFDVNPGMAPHGANVMRQDITVLQAGFGATKALFDDTAPEDPMKKVKAVIRADYECGFMKLMYGIGEESGKAETLAVEPSLLELRKKYAHVSFSKFSPHSLEYFVAFSKVPVIWKMWNDVVQPAGEQVPTPEDQWRKAANTWMRLAANNIVYYGWLKTIQAKSGIPAITLPAMMDKYFLKFRMADSEILGGGVVNGGKVKKDVNPPNARAEDPVGEGIEYEF